MLVFGNLVSLRFWSDTLYEEMMHEVDDANTITLGVEHGDLL